MWYNSLCNTCIHKRDIHTKRGSTFWMCGKSKEDDRFAKYPPQPVEKCPGYEPSKQPLEPENFWT
ncbi:MAG: hypothetical protein AAGI38_13150 [Bacteroidota bacterium]